MASNYAFVVLEWSQRNGELFSTKFVAFRHCFHITGIFGWLSGTQFLKEREKTTCELTWETQHEKLKKLK